MRHRHSITIVTALGLLALAPAAIASGGGGGGGGAGNPPCTPLTMIVAVGHSDSGESGIAATATVRNCTSSSKRLQLTVSAPGSGTVASKSNLAEGPGGSLTIAASPIGSTPLLLHYGQTYQVVAVLSDTTAVQPVVLSRQTFSVTMPPGPVR